jgi:hypothetical protein
VGASRIGAGFVRFGASVCLLGIFICIAQILALSSPEQSAAGAQRLSARGSGAQLLSPPVRQEFDAFLQWVRPQNRENRSRDLAATLSWPVPGTPTVRSDFYDLRFSRHEHRWVLHGGLDISVDERTWPEGAPVRALESGEVWDVYTFRGCSRVRVGRFGYGHVHPRPGLRNGTRLAAGDLIGRSCPREWHIHLTEWRTDGDCQPGMAECRINPLRPGGLLHLPDRSAPQVTEVRRSANNELVARIDDPVGEGFFSGIFEPLIVRHRPYRVWIDGELVFEKSLIRQDPSEVFDGVGTRTRRNVKAETCLKSGVTGKSACDGVYWLRLGSIDRCVQGCWLEAADVEGNRTRQWIVPT